MLQWMFFEQYNHEPYVAVARAWITLFGIPPERSASSRRAGSISAATPPSAHGSSASRLSRGTSASPTRSPLPAK
jgi:hypothetical protein